MLKEHTNPVAPQELHEERIVIVGNREPIGKDSVRFRLIYSGQLLGASRVDTRGSHKHEIRKSLSTQLQRLWETKQHLRRYATQRGFYSLNSTGRTIGGSPEKAQEQGYQAGLDSLSEIWVRKQARFIPLVTSEICVRCKVDILFLRPEEKNYILQGGDLDNRLKTLFDAFRVPKDTEQVLDQNTLFVLLEDDSLISEVSIVTDNLLLLPGRQEIHPTDAFLVIDVQLEPASRGINSWVFE
ncbi:MAG: hypothetical protein ACLGQX_15200 [Acidobacteriota bacterium]